LIEHQLVALSLILGSTKNVAGFSDLIAERINLTFISIISLIMIFQHFMDKKRKHVWECIFFFVYTIPTWLDTVSYFYITIEMFTQFNKYGIVVNDTSTSWFVLTTCGLFSTVLFWLAYFYPWDMYKTEKTV
jgi:hypothetical protein